jgi:16S rRNA (uracil1498-N3)-methyltransferase
MDYFVIPADDVFDSSLVIRGEELKHLSRVLRKKVGERIFVTDGNDRMYEAVIRAIHHDEAECEIVQARHGVNEPKVQVTLAVSLLKNPARFDFLVEKATELGVRTIVPMMCKRTIPHHEKHERLQKIVVAAVKQSGRSYVPRLLMLTSFEAVISNAHSHDVSLIAHEATEQSHHIGTVLKHHPDIASALVVVGPEGGFTDEELALASGSGCVPISLGSRRLRAETAALIAVSTVVGSW